MLSFKRNESTMRSFTIKKRSQYVPTTFLLVTVSAMLCLRKGQLDAAIEHCRAALLIRPDNPDCHTILAVALDEKGQSAEAIQHYEKAVGDFSTIRFCSK